MDFKSVLIDTNICIDAALFRKPFVNEALKIIEGSEKNYFTGHLSAHSFDTIFYLLRSDFDKERLYAFLDELRTAFNVAEVTQSIIDKALQLRWDDFEDAIHYQAALASGCDAIVSRNEKDFKQTTLPVLSPHQFLKQLYNS